MSYLKGLPFVFFLLLTACSMRSGPQPQSMTEESSIQYQFAFQFFQERELVRALSAALRAREITPHNTDILNLLGLIYFQQGKYDQAEETFESALALDEDVSEVYTNMGALYYEQERYEESVEVLEKALNDPLYLYPERVYNNIGLAYKAMGETNQARESFEKAISHRSSYYLPYQNLGKLWVEEGEPKRAESLFREASRLCEDCVEPRYRLGTVLLETDQPQKALEVFQEGYKIAPDSYYGQLCQKFLVDEE